MANPSSFKNILISLTAMADKIPKILQIADAFTVSDAVKQAQAALEKLEKLEKYNKLQALMQIIEQTQASQHASGEAANPDNDFAEKTAPAEKPQEKEIIVPQADKNTAAAETGENSPDAAAASEDEAGEEGEGEEEETTDADESEIDDQRKKKKKEKKEEDKKEEKKEEGDKGEKPKEEGQDLPEKSAGEKSESEIARELKAEKGLAKTAEEGAEQAGKKGVKEAGEKAAEKAALKAGEKIAETGAKVAAETAAKVGVETTIATAAAPETVGLSYVAEAVLLILPLPGDRLFWWLTALQLLNPVAIISLVTPILCLVYINLHAILQYFNVPFVAKIDIPEYIMLGVVDIVAVTLIFGLVLAVYCVVISPSSCLLSLV